ncbi:MAG: ABC transporter permease [Gemmatimonadota bacterium]|nr:MAG: ABC transporter permease [Gemmatimonadota bacterium]
MNKIRAVILREYLGRVRSRWFIVSTVLAPTLVIGAMAFPILLASHEPGAAVVVGVLDYSGGAVAEQLVRTSPFADGRMAYYPAQAGGRKPTIDSLRQLVLAEQIDGFVYFPADVLEGGKVEFWGRDVGQSFVRGTLGPAVTSAVQRVQARALGLAPQQEERLTRTVALETVRVTKDGGSRNQGEAVVTANILSFLIYLVVLLYSAMMLRAAVAEKSTKTVEIILSSIRPWELMLGKTLGVGAVGLTQITAWLLLILLALPLAGSASALAGLEFLRNLPVGWDTLFLFIGLFLTGYFLYGGMYASVGALASNEQEAQQLQFPVTLLVVIPVLILPIVLNSPTGSAATVLSWIPFFTPVLFLGRYVLGGAALWEVPLVFLAQLLAILLIAWIGGRIYRVALLMTGKRPTLPEIVRWIKHG